MCFQLVHAAPQLRVVKALRVKKKKLQTRRPPIPTNPFAHPPSHTPIESPTLTHHPSHPRRATTMQQYVQQHMSWYMQCLSLFRGGISIFLRFSNTPGSEGSVPARAPLHAPARRVGHRRQFLCRGRRELICGAGVANSWYRGWSSGTRHCSCVFSMWYQYIFQRSIWTSLLPPLRSSIRQ